MTGLAKEEAATKPAYLVRPAVAADISSISTIAAWYVRNTVLTFRYNPATEEELLQEFYSIGQERLPYLIAADKSTGTILGYCYAARFRPAKLGYKPTVELSLYCDPDHRSKGIGSLLLKEVLQALRNWEPGTDSCISSDLDKVGVKTVLATMAVDETGPGGGLTLQRFYERAGFEQAGRLKHVGYKFGRWIDSIYMQLSL
ncbi:acyl-CoA N-acyltransferase [Paraphaeosphaeria sporulosa]|uniref:Acyl-CoA N-acyltransferase n=1 Tax=Paraphaeosphaeria sporulosa TaxID=1460663 RepID=A0A177CCI8_9PLEO|nr:acyl-CoA N-acyltransferase [Paraphaeosphaeria sporulosa]OAG05036.1 acyl-CoA N-acyltransferase [Paraphaeosphaeria sporulosa]